MADVYKTETMQESVILVGISAEETNIAASLDELEELAKTAGACVVGRLIQHRDSIHAGTYLGKGKIEELALLAARTEATGIICDDELTPAQMANLSDALQVKVMDRTMVILDIFAGRAKSREGKIQVELAQLRYRATRLTGLGRSLSRLGGGIGTRGPGETKLEMDRRQIKSRISRLKRDLAEVEAHREVTRRQRETSPVVQAALVGYTNAGKSTLFRTLTGADVLVEDQLFATLDPTTRAVILESGRQVLLTDTVGFIRKLPHHLIEAFRSTLEEARYADIVIHVVDASNPRMDTQMFVVYDTLRELKITDKPVITAFNKMDLPGVREHRDGLRDLQADDTVYISAIHEESLNPLLQSMERILLKGKVCIECLFPYTEAGKVSVIRRYGQIFAEEYRDTGVFIQAYIPEEIYASLKKESRI